MDLMDINVCPSNLTEGHHEYSNKALKRLFDGKHVSPVLNFDSPASTNTYGRDAIRNVSAIIN